MIIIPNYNNKSLSARIKRRNKQGFAGEGTAPTVIKMTPYGSIVKEKVQDKYQNIKNFLRKHYHKHAGSKSATTLSQYM